VNAFGAGGASLLQRLRPTPRIDVADLLEVADAVLPTLTGPHLRVELVRRTSAGSVVVLEEDERSLHVELADLADDMTRAGVAPTSEAMATALDAWVARRPVTDATAAAAGVAVLDWTDAVRSSVGWRVVVRRGEVALPWTPLPGTSPGRVPAIRSAAAGRSATVDLTLRVEGPVALWSHPAAPALATTVLADPDRALARIAEAGLPVDDVHAVVTPHRPLACADRSVAARLAGESPEVSVTLPWARLPELGWL
jgi:hypothetical protein